MKFDPRLQMVRCAEDDGLKPAARQSGCTVRIVRKWWRRWLADNRSRQSLMDRSRAPHSCPHKSAPRVEAQIVRERKAASDRGFSYCVEILLRAKRRFIPPGKKNHQADVETLHERIEAEFFDLERFVNKHDFFQKAGAWQLWWNVVRKNGHKANRAPDEILLEERPERDRRVRLLPALDLDLLAAKRALGKTLNKSPSRGYYVPALPAYGTYEVGG
jgi:transposase-like protein